MDDYLYKIEHFLKQEDRTHNREHVSSVALYRDYQKLIQNALEIVRRREADYIHAARRKLLHKHWQDADYRAATRSLRAVATSKLGKITKSAAKSGDSYSALKTKRKLAKAMTKATKTAATSNKADAKNDLLRKRALAAKKANNAKHAQFMRHLEKKARINKGLQRSLMTLVRHEMVSPSDNAVRKLQ